MQKNLKKSDTEVLQVNSHKQGCANRWAQREANPDTQRPPGYTRLTFIGAVGQCRQVMIPKALPLR